MAKYFETPVRLKRRILLIVGGVFADIFVIGLPLFGVVVFLLSSLYFFGVILVALFKKKFHFAKLYFVLILIMVCMAPLSVYGCKLNTELAKERALAVAEALEAYHAQQQKYPANLSELCPKYLDSIPFPKYCLFCLFTIASDHHYTYMYFPEQHPEPTFSFVSDPPFGRWFWNFEKKEWQYLD